MTDIFINGERKSIDAKNNLSAVLLVHGFDCARVAVAVNSEFIPRGDYERFFLKTNDAIDVVAPVAGG